MQYIVTFNLEIMYIMDDLKSSLIKNKVKDGEQMTALDSPFKNFIMI